MNIVLTPEVVAKMNTATNAYIKKLLHDGEKYVKQATDIHERLVSKLDEGKAFQHCSSINTDKLFTEAKYSKSKNESRNIATTPNTCYQLRY